MSSELITIKQQLETRKAELLQRLSHIQEDITRPHSSDWSEQAQERENDEVMSALGNESKLELRKVSRALERMANGDYTTCSQCGEAIALERLKAIPYTDRCIRCAAS